MEGNEYGVTTTEMDQIMTMDLDDMTESQKEIWRKETMKRIDETTKNTKTVLEKCAETRRRHEKSEEETKKLNERWKDFEDRFNTSIKKLCVKIVQTLEVSGLTQNMDQIKEESKYSPEKMSSKEAAKLLKNKKNIIILTGAGLSAASGIKTYRGKDGIWTKMLEKGENPERFATLQYFKLYPVEKWKWCFDFIEQIKSKKPNEGHHAILKYQEYCQKNKINCTLITQNIDNYHAELLKKSDIIKTVDTEDGGKGHGFTNGVLEIHGNTLYMRCLDECCENIYTIPPLDPDLDIEDQIPKCNKCGSIMRPNILWFDESYCDEYYKLDCVKTAIESDVDALIVVGTALTTALAFKIVKECLKRDILTIEVNLEPECKVGHSVQVIEKSETALPILLKTYK